jgi:uncharacterized protein (DUF169 family)
MATGTDYAPIERTLVSSFGPLRLIAVSYLDAPPEGVERFSGTVPSGCSFWSLASRNGGFYTVASDHLNCPIGAYTHAIDLPSERAPELEHTLSLMSSVGYVRLEEMSSIPRLPKPPAFACYAPLSSAVVPPDVVIASGRPASLMRLQEAVARAGAASALPLLGRPTCMALPAAMAHGAVMSTGCIGNRIYTGLGDDELYLIMPGRSIADVAAEANVIASANQTLAEYHEDRRASLTS